MIKYSRYKDHFWAVPRYSLYREIPVFIITNGYHSKTVANPQRAPTTGTIGYDQTLGVNGYYIRRRFAYDTSANVRPNMNFGNWHHRHGSVRTQPIGLVISAGVVTNIVGIAKHEGHCAKTFHTRTGKT